MEKKKIGATVGLIASGVALIGGGIWNAVRKKDDSYERDDGDIEVVDLDPEESTEEDPE